MGLVPRSSAHRVMWRCSMACVGAVSVAGAVRDTLAPGAALPLIDALPAADIGLGWIAPGLVGLAVGALVEVALRDNGGR